MRKYQQLLLVVISSISVIILLLKNSENHRLKDVLAVVNIFGRNDSMALRQIEEKLSHEIFDLTLPLPLWAIISESFYAYDSFWHRNELVAGGEAVSLVSGKSGATVNFQCLLEYDQGQTSTGKFSFQRMDEVAASSSSSEFTNYNFFCRSTRDKGTPKRVIFKDQAMSTKTAYKLRLRQLKDYTVKHSKRQPEQLVVCVDMVNFNGSSSFAKNTHDLMQFFVHHKVLGVQHFVVYNGDEITLQQRSMLLELDVKLHLMPFNFPFAINDDQQSLRALLSLDCIWRNAFYARNVLLLQPNEFFIPNAKLGDTRSVLRATEYKQAKRLEVKALSVCADTRRQLLLDNVYYDPEGNYKLYIHRVPVTFPPTTDAAIALPISAAQAHKYTDCAQVGPDGLHDWRNALREEFTNHLKLLREQISSLLRSIVNGRTL